MRGSFWSFDGEIFVQKGLGRARIHWPLSDGSRLKIDFFTTHLVSYTNNPNRDNNFVRYMQTLETVKYIDKTDADVKIFAGNSSFHGKKSVKLQRIWTVALQFNETITQVLGKV